MLTGTAIMNVSSITVTGTNSSDFGQTNTCGATLSSGNTCNIAVVFAPEETGNPLTATITVTFTGTTGSPLVINLSGQGISPSGVVTAPALPSMTGNMKASGTLNAGQTPVADTKKVILRGVEYTRGGGK